jgi:exonuclease SbcC
LDLNSLCRLAEAKVAAVETEIASYEERLAAWDSLQARYQSLATEIAQDEAQLTALATQLATLQSQRDALKAQAEQVQQLQAQRQQAQSQMDGKQQAIALLSQSLDQAKQAVTICANTRPAYEAYRAAEEKLETLNQQQAERLKLQKRQQQLQKTLESRAADMTRLQVQLDGFAAAATEIEQLQPLVAEQTQLETQLQALQQQQQALAQVQGELQAMTQQATQQAQQVARLEQEIEQLQALTTPLRAVPELEQQRDRLQQQLSRLEAARQFEAELQMLVQQGQATCDRYQTQAEAALQTLAELQQSVPLLSTEAIASLQTALETGVAVNRGILSEVQQILTDLSGQTDGQALRSQLATIRQQLADLAQQQATVATLPQRQQQLAQLQEQQAQLTHRIQSLQVQLGEGDTLPAQLQDLQTALGALEDPKGRCAVLTRSRQQQPAIQNRHDEMQAAQAGIQQQLAALETELQAFAELETAIAT